MSLKKLLAATAVAGAMVSAPAQAFLLNWYLDPDGPGGPSGLIQISEFLDIVGPSYVETSVPAAGVFSFEEWGAIRSPGHDGGAAYTGFTGELTALFNLTGNGNLGGSVSYTTGAIEIWSDSTPDFANGTFPPTFYGADDGTSIGAFTILGGGGTIDPTGIPNGTQTIIATATALTPGYWFMPDGVTDISTLLGPVPVVFGFATTNASRVGNPATEVISDIVGGFAGNGSFTNCLPGETAGAIPGSPCTGATGNGEFVISNNGQYRLQVPEPGSLALLGIALLSAAGLARRKPQA
jgi:hypothetical protein